MRKSIPSLVAALSVAAAATPGLAQPLQTPSFQQHMDDQLRASELQAQQEMANRQAVIQQNQLTALEAQVRTQQAIADIAASGRSPRLASPPGAAASLDPGSYASIPDDKLAASNARVKAAAENRR
jgi:predicted small lipoprotein YifL